MSHILEFLGQHARVYTLDEYLQQCLPPRIASFVKQYEDPPAYLDVLRSTYIVCEEPLGRAPRDTYAFAGTAAVPVSEVLRRVVYRLLLSSKGRSNILAQGFSIVSGARDFDSLSSVPIECLHTNSSITRLSGDDWALLLARIGEEAFTDMVMRHSIFVFPHGTSNAVQVAGIPLSVWRGGQRGGDQTQRDTRFSNLRNANEIVFNRSKHFYSKPLLSRTGQVVFGMRRKHCLSRYRDSRNPTSIAIMMAYIFPRQFKLHNVFTSPTDKRFTTFALNDYTSREHEIELFGALNGHIVDFLPKRLARGSLAWRLVERLVRNNACLNYRALLNRYCECKLPSPLDPQIAQQVEFDRFTVDHSRYVEFVLQVLARVVPKEFLGTDANWHMLMKHITKFLSLRRFENLTLHYCLQGIKIRDIPWLSPPSLRTSKPLSLTDARKREQLFQEFVYWLIDSFIIPLLSNTFYCTESHLHRNKVLVFRLDDWQNLYMPAMTSAMEGSFVPVQARKREKLPHDHESMLCGSARLLPKGQGARLIMNLKRRQLVYRNHVPTFLPSVNSTLAPLHAVLKFESQRRQSQAHSNSFSLHDRHEIFSKLHDFKQRFFGPDSVKPKVYMVRTDIKSCFDSIDRQRVLQLASSLLQEDEYTLLKYIKVQFSNLQMYRSFNTQASATDDYMMFADIVSQQLSSTSNSVLIDQVVNQSRTRAELVRLLNQHLMEHSVRLGHRSYTQTQGIPQGSRLSVLLCNLYLEMIEARELSGFLSREDTVFFRLIDDGLLVTLDKSVAEAYVHVMHNILPTYGCTVNPAKTLLVNFNASVDGMPLARMRGARRINYCGSDIDTTTLEVLRHEPHGESGMANSLTLEYCRRPGKSLMLQILRVLQLQLRPLYYSFEFSRGDTVIRNAYQTFRSVALRYVYSVRGLGQAPSLKYALSLMEQVVWKTSHVINKGRLTLVTIRWLLAHAFIHVLKHFQTPHFSELRQYLLALKQRTIPARQRSKILAICRADYT